MRRSRIEFAKPEIITLLDHQSQRVFAFADLEQLLLDKREEWRLPQSLGSKKFRDFLVEEIGLQAVRLPFPFRAQTRYLWGEASPYELALSLRPGGYLSHYTALRLHDLAPEGEPKVLYVNEEQAPKFTEGGQLRQDAIHAAFARPARQTTNRAAWGEYEYCLLNGKNTGNAGVEEATLPSGLTVRVTGLERTLLDAVVRPAYSGGSKVALEAFTRAAERVSVPLMARLLKKLGHTYPYHQPVGFYLERSGAYDAAALEVFRKRKKQFDFYVDHRMEKPLYSKEWRLYYPSDLTT